MTTVATRALLALLHLGGGRGNLLPQGSWPTWTKILRRPSRLTWSFSSFPVRYYFTHTSRRSPPPPPRNHRMAGYPALLARVGADLAYQSLTETTVPDTATPEIIRSGKKIKAMNDQQTVQTRHPYYPPTLTVTSCQRSVLEIVTADHIMPSHPKTFPRAQLTLWKSRAVSKNSNRCTMSQMMRSMWLPYQWSSSPRLTKVETM